MEITYSRADDYLLPNIRLSDSPAAPPLGHYGRMRKAFLKVHRPIEYSRLLLSERLYPHCRETDDAAESRMSAIPDREIANEVILSELVYGN